MQPDAVLAQNHSAPRTRRFGEIAAHLLNFATNHVVAHLPSYALRRGWYRSVMGIKMGSGSSVQTGCYLWSYGPGSNRRLVNSVGDRTIVNRGCCLDVRSGLRIGNDVSISPEVAILTTQHDLDHPDFALQGRAVVIEDHVWIGMRAMVLPGVTIGRGAVVAAGAVVTSDVAPLDVVAGVPARVIGRRSQPPDYRLPAPALFE